MCSIMLNNRGGLDIARIFSADAYKGQPSYTNAR